MYFPSLRKKDFAVFCQSDVCNCGATRVSDIPEAVDNTVVSKKLAFVFILLRFK